MWGSWLGGNQAESRGGKSNRLVTRTIMFITELATGGKKGVVASGGLDESTCSAIATGVPGFHGFGQHAVI